MEKINANIGKHKESERFINLAKKALKDNNLTSIQILYKPGQITIKAASSAEIVRLFYIRHEIEKVVKLKIVII